MKIQLKLKHTELDSLVKAFEVAINFNEQTDRKEAVVKILLLKMYRKLKKESIILEPRTYRFAIGTESAIAFVDFFQTSPFSNTSHAGNLIQQLVLQFDQHTASYIK